MLSMYSPPKEEINYIQLFKDCVEAEKSVPYATKCILLLLQERALEEDRKKSNEQQGLMGRLFSMPSESNVIAALLDEITKLSPEKITYPDAIFKQSFRTLLTKYIRQLQAGAAREVLTHIENTLPVEHNDPLSRIGAWIWPHRHRSTQRHFLDNYYRIFTLNYPEHEGFHSVTSQQENNQQEDKSETPWEITLEEIMLKKGYKNPFVQKNPPITLDSPLGEHVAWAYREIYSRPYPSSSHPMEAHGGIARFYHGIQHVTRAAMLAPVIANLYRKHGDSDALALNDDEIKLIQLALLFHDAARENEGTDEWDHESAIFLYYYLTRVLHVESTKAQQLAEAIANKGVSPKGYFSFEEKEGKLVCQWKKASQGETVRKNIYQKIIHDSDCLDVIRARDHFDASYLDFYQDIARQNQLAFEEMALLIMEVRSLIHTQGDGRNCTNIDIKDEYEKCDAYQACLDSIIKHKNARILFQLKEKLLPFHELQQLTYCESETFDIRKGLTEENLRHALREGKIFARSIASPSAISKVSKSGESLAELEFRKMMREQGNLYRSVSVIGNGGPTFADAGGLEVDPDLSLITSISGIDKGTGRGKKGYLKGNPKMPRAEAEKGLASLLNKFKMGGSSTRFAPFNFPSAHVEILYDIRKIDAIYFSNDPNLYNIDAHGSPNPVHKYAPILKAIYLKKIYERSYQKHVNRTLPNQQFFKVSSEQKYSEQHSSKTLPIFEYSGIHNFLRIVNEDEELTEVKIIDMWVAMCSDYMQNLLANNNVEKLLQLSSDDIKTLSMYKTITNKYASKNAPADSNYDPELREKINQAIENEKNRLLKVEKENIIKKFKEVKEIEHISILDDKIFLKLTQIPGLLSADAIVNRMQDIRSYIAQQIKEINDIRLWQKCGTVDIPSFDEMPVSLYKLCRAFNLENEAAQVRKECYLLINKFAKQYLSTIQPMLSNLPDEVCEIINIFAFFDIKNIPPEFKKLLNYLMEKTRDGLITIPRPPENIEEICTLLQKNHPQEVLLIKKMKELIPLSDEDSIGPTP